MTKSIEKQQEPTPRHVKNTPKVITPPPRTAKSIISELNSINSKSPKKLITIRGERHTGTNWVRQIINQNCPKLIWSISKNLDADGKYGWKHGILPNNFTLSSDDFMVIIYRDFRSWVPKMYEEPYAFGIPYYRSKPQISFDKFLNQTWNNYKQPDEVHKEKYDNIFDMRSKKYKSWMHFAQNNPDKAMGVAYEDLLIDQKVFYKAMVQRFSLELYCRTEFKPVTNYSKFGKTENRKFQEQKFEWSKPDIEKAMKYIDTSLESNLGYLH